MSFGWSRRTSLAKSWRRSGKPFIIFTNRWFWFGYFIPLKFVLSLLFAVVIIQITSFLIVQPRNSFVLSLLISLSSSFTSLFHYIQYLFVLPDIFSIPLELLKLLRYVLILLIYYRKGSCLMDTIYWIACLANCCLGGGQNKLWLLYKWKPTLFIRLCSSSNTSK